MTLPKPETLRRVLSSTSVTPSPPSAKRLARQPSLIRRSSSTLSIPGSSAPPPALSSSLTASSRFSGYIAVGAVCLLVLMAYQGWVVSQLHKFGTGCMDDVTGFLEGRTALPTTTTEQQQQQQALPPFSSSAKVGLCCITKDATRYLDEWIDYHLYAMDFHEIYLFDNSDDFQLKYYHHPFAPEDKITVTHFPGFGALHQRAAYELCVANHGDRNDYMAFWDDDEFLVLHKHDSVGAFVKDHLVNGSSLTINWRIFGTSNHTHYRPLPLVTQRFVYRNVTDRRVKSIVRPKDFKFMINPHAVKLRGQKAHQGHRKNVTGDKWKHMFYDQTGYHRWRDVNGGGNYTWDGARNDDIPPESSDTTVAVIHHYKYKSNEDWEWKNCFRWGFSGMPHKDCGTDPMVGHIFDDSAWQTLKRRVPRYAALEEWS